MGLYRAKARFVAALAGIEDRLVARGVAADHLTLLALPLGVATGAALVAGAHLHRGWWLAVAPLSLARMALNALDGSVARRTGTEHRRGALLNELTDRAADLATVAAGYGTGVPFPLVTAALVVTVLVPFVAVTAQAVTGTRLHDGPMGKPDRVLVLSVGALAATLTGGVALAVGFALIGLLGAVTIATRVRTAMRHAATLDRADQPLAGCDATVGGAAVGMERTRA